MTSRLSLQEDGPYTGTEQRLVLAIDIGTTASACTLVHLMPGQIPVPRAVQSWPASPQESKVPSLVLYDNSGRARAFCAEAKELLHEHDAFELVDMSDDSTLHKAEFFKTLLHPSSMASPTLAGDNASIYSLDSNEDDTRLPPGVSLDQVYSDLIAYLVTQSRHWFESTTLQGEQIYAALAPKCTIILAHPDGWDDVQQDFLRQAVFSAGVVSPNEPNRVEFVRESEASCHWALKLSQTQLQPGNCFTIVDAGGSTSDTAFYEVVTVSPQLTLKELKGSESLAVGGVNMTRAGERLIQDKLSSSKFRNRDFVEEGIESFETRKRLFAGSETKMYIKVGSSYDSDAKAGVSKGRLTLSGDEVKELCFDPSVNKIVASVERQSSFGNSKASHILVVGGLGESPYLQAKLKTFFANKGVAVVTTTEPSKKAASEGAILWYLKRLVVARAARSTFGIAVVYAYNRDDPEHLSRSSVLLPDKSKGVRGGFSAIIAKDTVVGAEEFTSMPYTRLIQDVSQLKGFEVELFAFDGNGSPGWSLDAYGNLLEHFRQVCTISADLSQLQRILVPKPGAGGVPFYEVSFRIGVSFGGSSLRAKLMWQEDGEAKEGKASIVLRALRGSS